MCDQFESTNQITPYSIPHSHGIVVIGSCDEATAVWAESHVDEWLLDVVDSIPLFNVLQRALLLTCCKCRKQLTVNSIPKTCSIVPRSGSEATPIGTEGYLGNTIRMASQFGDYLTTHHVPQACCVIPRSTGKARTIWAEC